MPWRRLLPMLRCGAVIAAVVGFALGAAARADPPEGFADRLLPVGFDQAVGLCFDWSGRMYVWEKGGKVWTVDGIRDGALGGERHPTPLVDISEEVGNWGDHGLLGFALDPNFAFNGYVYLLYVVDYHHARWFGTTVYHSDWNEYNRDTIGRLVRYTARADDDFRSVDPESRHVFIGATLQDAFPVCYTSHSAGTLAFGEDGTLLASFGDTASYSQVDVGGVIVGWASTCAEENIIRPDECVGALRAQNLASLNGKVLRLNPASGEGVASNPYYDTKNPDATMSKVWAWGLRNPYRFTVRPGTGNLDPAAADPGSIYVGDVGWNAWEEINVATGGGTNFGWPLFEGLEVNGLYQAGSATVQNLHAPNPLYNPETLCLREHFTYRELLVQDRLGPGSWANPCDPLQQIPEQPHRAMHTRPVIDYSHLFSNGGSRTGTYDASGAATVIGLNDPGSPVPGPNFIGTTTVGGAWVTGDAWPAEWANAYYHADFTGEWIKALSFDDEDRPTLVRDFSHEMGSMVDLEWDPVRGALWYIRFTRTGVCEVRAIIPAGDLDPVAVAAAEPVFGAGPLSVTFSSAGSRDPEGGEIVYHWDFGDGATSDEANPTHEYASAKGGAPARYDVTLTVTDILEQQHTASLSVWVDNTPPVIEVTSPQHGATMPPGDMQTIVLSAIVSDAEQGGEGEGVTCRWLAILHHNEHTHLIGIVAGCNGEIPVTPHPCEDGSQYSYEFVLEATDSLGLMATATRMMIPADCNENGVPDNCDIALGEPDLNDNGIPDACEPQPECPADFDGNGVVNSTDVSGFITAWFIDLVNGTLVTDFDANGVVNSTDVSAFINAYFEADPLCLT